jgi:pyruvate kinase
MLADRRVKIVSTLGPASNTPEIIENLVRAGVNVFRLNFSHSTHEEHLKSVQCIRSLSKKLSAPITILQDLQGPKIRVGKLKNSIELNDGDEVTLTTAAITGDSRAIPIDYKRLHEFAKVGMKVLFDDGLIEMVIVGIKGNEIHCKVIFGGELKERKGVNIPGAQLDIECLTEKDLKDLEFGIKNEVDYIALSFVRHEDDIVQLRTILDKRNSKARIVAKIEMLEALTRLDEIIHKSDAIMVARGDLAVEVGQTQLAHTQKNIIQLCNALGKPVITATQMLESMVKNPRPTRAEVTDVSNAVLDGSDALMLSAETASGKYPVRCVQTMHDVIVEVERTIQHYYNLNLNVEFLSVAEAIAASACLTALKLDARAIICLTTSGKTARLIASFRPKALIFAATHNMDVLNKLELIWGIHTITINPYESSEGALKQIEAALLSFNLVEPGDKIILTLGIPVSERGTTNSLRVHTVQDNKTRQTENLPLRFREG